MEDIRENKPWTTNQIKNTKPNIPRTFTPLSGYIAGSMNGGHNKVIAWKQVMAGEKHKEFRLQASIKMLTPLTPTYQNLTMTIRTYFVPNSRVWTNAEKYTAQKGGTAENKIMEIPNMSSMELPTINDTENSTKTNITNGEIWNKIYASAYIPRTSVFKTVPNTNSITPGATMPPASILKLRGRKAIFNDFERNKEYEEEIVEFKDDNVSEEEWKSYFPNSNGITSNYDELLMRAKKQDSYYSNYRTEIQGFEEALPGSPETDEDKALINWAAWESKIAEARSQAENAQKTDWEIIAEIRGSKKLSEGKVQLIGKTSFNLNYAAITQSSYNNNEEVEDKFRVLGQQGAYSYTEVNIPLYAGMEFVEEGYIHVIATVSADTVYENGWDRLELNISPLDQYRPDLKDDKNDVLYAIEMGGSWNYLQGDIIGFKRKYNEYFKLPNIIQGTMTSANYYKSANNNPLQFNQNEQIQTNKTFQFFMTSADIYFDYDKDQTIPIKIYKDYTDFMINKNLTVKNELNKFQNSLAYSDYEVMGEDQIFYVGKCLCIADLPIDEEIKNNYTKWGEH